jgi:hypothetical protein
LTDYFKKGRELATAATTAVIVIAATVITTAAENNNKKNNNPAAIAATKAVTHVFFLLSFLLKHSMKKYKLCEKIKKLGKMRLLKKTSEINRKCEIYLNFKYYCFSMPKI